ncbi:MAG TPA: GatB/YqeY domain-containing protein [Roseiflexaceae bacterium]|nr:GatB/YqeY domain-containing protein [Roseiflexaceae bacterium]
MNIQEQLQHDLKSAMRAGERTRVEVIRMALAALKNAQMAQVKAAFDAAGGEAGGAAAQEAASGAGALSEAAMQDVLAKEVKRRREAAEAYRAGARPDLAAAEEAEAAILEAYLPRQLTPDELRPLVAAAIAELGDVGPGDMGKVMPALMQRFKGRADGRIINLVAREVLSNRH